MAERHARANAPEAPPEHVEDLVVAEACHIDRGDPAFSLGDSPPPGDDGADEPRFPCVARVATVAVEVASPTGSTRTPERRARERAVDLAPEVRELVVRHGGPGVRELGLQGPWP